MVKLLTSDTPGKDAGSVTHCAFHVPNKGDSDSSLCVFVHEEMQKMIRITRKNRIVSILRYIPQSLLTSLIRSVFKRDPVQA